MPELRRAGDPSGAAASVDEIVQDGRGATRVGISELFASEAPARELLAWKEVYDGLRDALQGVAATSESLMTTAIRNR